MNGYANSKWFCLDPRPASHVKDCVKNGLAGGLTAMTARAARATGRVPRKLVYSQKRDRILALWNAGDHTMAEIGVVFGTHACNVAGVLCRARRTGLDVLAIAPSERARRAARSRRLWCDGQPETDVITPEASLQLRTAWLSGVSAVRIAVMLDAPERLVWMEARRLGLPSRKLVAGGGLPQ
jgi:hypothetical protein